MLFCNKTKGGVDVCDKMCKQYSARSMVRRWPQVHFQNMLDVVGVNTFSLVCLNAVGMGDIHVDTEEEIFFTPYPKN